MRRLAAALLAAAVTSAGVLAAGPPAAAAPALPFPVGTVFAAQEDRAQVVSIDIDGVVSTVGTGPGASGVAVDAVGNVYALTLDGALVEYAADGRSATLATGLHSGGGVAVDRVGNVYVADQQSGRVLKVPAATRQVTTFATGYVSPWGVAVDLLGNVFVSDSGAGAVFEVPVDGGPQTAVASGFTTPTGLAVSTSGDLFVADLGSQWLTKVNLRSGARTPFLGGLQRPYGVALDPFGNVYVSDAAFDAIAVGTEQQGSGYIAGATNPRGVALFVPPPTFTAQQTTPSGVVGTAYSATAPTVDVPSGESAPTFSVVNGALPPGLSLDPATGGITGTPTVPGTYSFEVQVANAVSGSLSGPLSITISAPPGFVAAFGPDRFGDTRVPASVGTNPSGVSAVAAAYNVSFAVANGRVIGWGDNGIGQTTIPAAAQSNVTAVAATSGGGLARKGDNTLVEWGFQAPRIPAGLSGSTRPQITAIAGENVFYLALAGGKVTEWGAPDNGFGISRVPAEATSGISAIASGTGHALALKDDGVIGWGYDNLGQATVPDAAKHHVIAIDAGGYHSIALKDDHTIVTWGGPSALNDVPPAAQGNTVAVAAGQSFNAALLYDGTIVIWGTPDTTQTIAPPTDGSATTALAAGDRHLLTIRK